jgi:hypothetical protein
MEKIKEKPVDFVKYANSLSLKDQILLGWVRGYYLRMGKSLLDSEQLSVEWMKKHIAKREAKRKIATL